MTQLAAEKLVLGTWGISGATPPGSGPLGYGRVGRSAAQEVLSEAWDGGIRWVDTCATYGAGQGFELLKAWQRTTGCQFNVVIKVGRPIVDGMPRSSCALGPLLEQIARERDELGRVAMLLIKDPPAELFVNGEIGPLLTALQARLPGLALGIATHRLECCQYLPSVQGHTVQLEFNALNAPTAAPVVTSLVERGWSVWGMQPLAYGFLGSRCAPGTFERDDWRCLLSADYVRVMQAGSASFRERWRDVFPDVPLARVAIAYCLAQAGLQRVVVGPKSAGQLRDAWHALALSAHVAFHATPSAVVGPGPARPEDSAVY